MRGGLWHATSKNKAQLLNLATFRISVAEVAKGLLILSQPEVLLSDFLPLAQRVMILLLPDGNPTKSTSPPRFSHVHVFLGKTEILSEFRYDQQPARPRHTHVLPISF